MALCIENILDPCSAECVSEGTDHLGMQFDRNVSQILEATYQPYTRYTLTVSGGNRSGNTNSGNLSVYKLFATRLPTS
jgi:hypothetical protein